MIDFISSYREASAEPRLAGLRPRELLLKTCKVEQWQPLTSALARLIAAKPHSADVERLISSYNVLKTNDRSSMSAATLTAYLIVRCNMNPVADWDPRPAVHSWINEKDRRPNQQSTKAHEQEYFKGILH